jgi:glucose/arabinose dehydrogenase
MSPNTRLVRRVASVVLVVTSLLVGSPPSSAAPAAVPLIAPSPAALATLPAGFTDSLVANIYGPTAIAFTPDGRILVTSQPGKLRVVQNGSLLSTPALDIANGWSLSHICNNRDRGLLGLAVDPAFASNHWIYLYYTYNKYHDTTCPTNTASAPVNRVSRFTLQNNNVVPTTTELVLLDNIPSPDGDHNGGDLKFGMDGFLYISVGDGGTGGAPARLKTSLSGKILRIRSDGNIPVSNPFVSEANAWRCGNTTGGTGTGPCKEVYAYGLRNPFRLAFDPNAASTRFFINDVGQDTWEEIDLGQAGADYGWNCFEGNHPYAACSPAPASVAPLFEYDHSSGCASITAGAFVPNGLWPAAYQGKYLYADYVCGKIFRLDPNGAGGYTSTEFSSGLGGVTNLRFGPYAGTQALYYLTYANGGQLRRISNSPAPVAALSASPTTGASPLAVHFDGSGSSDPGGSALTYDWAFGDGASLNGGLSATTTHTYTVTGVYTATLVVRNSAGLASAPASARVWVNNAPPQPVITAPAEGATFAVGQSLVATGQATDAEDGALPASALSWEVRLHHIDEANPGNAHWHPYANASGVATLTFNGPAPEDLTATALSYLEVRLTATDAAGQSTTVTRTLQPRRVAGSFQTNPSGLQLLINGLSYTMPRQFTLWEGWNLSLTAPLTQTDSLGQPWNFASWSDGGAASHTALTPASAVTYTAQYQSASTGSTLVLIPVVDAYVNAANPATNYGTAAALRTSASPTKQAFLRFRVQGTTGQPITRVLLRLYANESSTAGFTVFRVNDNTWKEIEITFNNKPALGAQLASSGPHAAGAWLNVDITGAVTGDGLYSFALTSSSTATVSYPSREAPSLKPKLQIELAGGSNANVPDEGSLVPQLWLPLVFGATP